MTSNAPPFRLLSFNIQAGLHTQHYGHYVTGAWRHAMPARGRRENLLQMAKLMRGYDFVAIQEADAGSIRTNRVNLIELLAEHAGFSHCGLTVTRNLAPFARICLGYLSRSAPQRVITHALPGRLPGRGALEVDLETPQMGALTVLVTHLALGRVSRSRQLAYLATLLRGQNGVLVGDLNGSPESLHRLPSLHAAGLRAVPGTPATYPSWQPRHSLDQVLLTDRLRVVSAEALPVALSDHLPLSVELAYAG